MKQFLVHCGVCTILILFTCSVQAEPPLDDLSQSSDDEQQLVAGSEDDQSQAEEWSDLLIVGPSSIFEGEASPTFYLQGRKGGDLIRVEETTFSYVSGAPFTVEPSDSGSVTVTPDEVSADAESAIRATVGSQSLDHTFTVVNKADPESSRGATIAQCSFYNDSQGREGFVGTGFFSFDIRTVDNFKFGSSLSSSSFRKNVLSTTRKIEVTSIGSGLPSYAEDGNIYISDGRSFGALTTSWYSGPGYDPGGESNQRFGTFRAKGWSSYTGDPTPWMSTKLDFTTATDTSADGRWFTKGARSNSNGEGLFDCQLSTDVDLPACGGTLELPSNQWRQISLPCNPGSHNNVASIFSEIPGVYGTDWVLYRYEPDENTYVQLDTESTLSQEEAYWIIQKNSSAVQVSMPQGSIPTMLTVSEACTSPQGCFIASPTSSIADDQGHWHMLGYPFDKKRVVSTIRLRTTSGLTSSAIEGCNEAVGCSLKQAKQRGVTEETLWTYTESGYKQITEEDFVSPWEGYWLHTLVNVDQWGNSLGPKPLRIHIPKPSE